MKPAYVTKIHADVMSCNLKMNRLEPPSLPKGLAGRMLLMKNKATERVYIAPRKE